MLVIIIVPLLIVLLQVYLSKQQNKWLGLILPILCFIGSIVATVGSISFSSITTTTLVESVTGPEKVIEQITSEVHHNEEINTASIILQAVAVFVVSNIGTVILLAIYKECRNKMSKQLELEKMAIQDLE